MCPASDGYIHPDGSINVSDLTQARHEGEIEAMARDFIAVTLDIPHESVLINRLK